MQNHKAHRVSAQLHSLLRGIRNLGISTFMVIIIFVLGPILEGKYFPVVQDIIGTYKTSDDVKMYFSVYGNKLRGECKFIEVKTLIGRNTQDEVPPIKGTVWFVDAGQGPESRPTGFQDFGTWAFVPKGDRVIVSATWSCHPFWNTEQQLGIWERQHNVQ